MSFLSIHKICVDLYTFLLQLIYIWSNCYVPSLKSLTTLHDSNRSTLISEILGIEPSPNNGTIGSLHYILQNATNLTETVENHKSIHKCALANEHNLTAMCECDLTQVL